MMTSRVSWFMSPCIAETVNSRSWSLSVSQSTLRRVEQKMTAWVMVTVSYRSHRVSSFQSSFSTAMSNHELYLWGRSQAAYRTVGYLPR